MSDREEGGRFAKGNKAASIDIDRERAKKVANDELHWCANMVFGTPYKELRAMIEDKRLEDESLFTYMIII